MKTKQTISETIYEQGYKAYNQRKGTSANPYKAGSKEWELWFDGWMKANRDDGN